MKIFDTDVHEKLHIRASFLIRPFMSFYLKYHNRHARYINIQSVFIYNFMLSYFWLFIYDK